MERKRCYLCDGEEFSIIHTGVRGSNDIKVLCCKDCGFVQLSNVIDDLDKFYESSKMRSYNPVADNIEDEKSVSYDDDLRRFEYIKNIIENKVYMDFGCGHGGVLQKSIEKTQNLYGVEPETRMREKIRGIKCFASLAEAQNEIHGNIDVITLFHVLEHLSDPADVLRNLSKMLSDEGRIIIEVPNIKDALLSLYNSKYYADFTYWICHLYYFSNETLKRVAEKAGLRVVSLEQIQRYPLANHLYWLTKGKPGGHSIWNYMLDKELDRVYGDKLARLGMADTIIAELSR